MIIKICGITSVEIAKLAEEAGATMIGFVFAESSRKVTPEVARTITRSLSSKIKTVGVFVNEEKEVIEEIASFAGLDYIQLHGDESPAFAQSITKPVIKAFSIDHVSDEILQTYPAEFFLIDSPGTTYRGGSGNTFDWSRLEGRDFDREKFILAGGLHAGNVRAAIEATRPRGVDVSSGVETMGKKDPEKIISFIKAVKATDA